MTSQVRIGISACLTGQDVRYNGGHLRDGFLMETIAPFVEWVPVCPEVELGMGVPREAVNLSGDAESPRMMGVRSRTDHTDAMNAWAEQRAKTLSASGLHGYVFAKDSPSCGLMRVKVYPDQGGPAARNGVGLFARAVIEQMPLLPVEETGRLNDPRLREHFVERLFVYRAWRELLDGAPTRSDLVGFHSDHKLTMMAHSPELARVAGRLVAQAGTMAWEDLKEAYGEALMACIARRATPRKHTNALHHAMGFLKHALDPEDKTELLDLIDRYRHEQVPLVVPLTLLIHHVRRSDTPDWLRRQTYLSPYPDELMLRNHV